MHLNSLEKKLPTVGVIMSVYALADPLEFEEALLSIHKQSYPSIYLFLYCDGTLTPPLNLIISKITNIYPASCNRVLKVFRSEIPSGLPLGLNYLIDILVANPLIKYVLRMDSDDISFPNRVSDQVEFMESNPEIDLSGSWCIEFLDQSGPYFYKRMPIKMEDILRFTVLRSPLVHPTVIFRRKIFDMGYRYKIDLKTMQDYELWTRLLIDGFHISNLPEYLLYFRMANNFYSRRTGLKRAFLEVSMRLSYAKKMGFLNASNIFKLLIFFCIRISPKFIKRISYQLFRG